MANPYREMTDEQLEEVRNRASRSATTHLSVGYGYGARSIARGYAKVASASRKEQQRRGKGSTPKPLPWWTFVYAGLGSVFGIIIGLIINSY